MIDLTKDNSPGAFWAALHEAEPGDPIVYHIGQHCGGQHRSDAMDACEKGLVSLVQKRNGPGSFIYIAQKNKQRTKR